jgi:hypothetical protein
VGVVGKIANNEDNQFCGTLKRTPVINLDSFFSLRVNFSDLQFFRHSVHRMHHLPESIWRGRTTYGRRSKQKCSATAFRRERSARMGESVRWQVRSIVVGAGAHQEQQPERILRSGK